MLSRVNPAVTITLLNLDLDGFSVISNGLGHHVGDEMPTETGVAPAQLELRAPVAAIRMFGPPDG